MMLLDKRLARFSLSFHPFAAGLPVEHCLITADMTHFMERCDHLVTNGGFAMVVGDAGSGKSTLIRCLQTHLSERSDLIVGVLTRPQASLADFYRELGSLFGVNLAPHNRWAGARVLRERWQEHWASTQRRPVLLIDEAQEMHAVVLGELRLLCAAELDAVTLLSVVLSGDSRLKDLLQERPLLPLASRFRIQHHAAPASFHELVQLLNHLLKCAGNPQLMSDGLKQSLAEHACGNHRSLIFLCDQLMEAALDDPNCQRLDEQLFARVVRPSQAGAGSNIARVRKAR